MESESKLEFNPEHWLESRTKGVHMRAAVFQGVENIVVGDVTTPKLEAGEVLLEIEACSVCGTDMRTYHHGHKNIQAPRVLGHEFVGRVVESAAPDAPVVVGDRVVMYIVLACGQCRHCRAGRANLCDDRTTMAYQHDGGFAQFMRVPSQGVRQLYTVQSDIPSVHMSLAEPLGCVINAYSRTRVGLKDSVVVFGAGPIGIMHALVARAQGAQRVVMLDVNAARLEGARGFDIDDTVLVSSDGAHLEAVKALTNGEGPSVVIVAVSAASACADALVMAGKGGRVNFFAGLPKTNPSASLDLNQVHYKELEISGSFSENAHDFQAAKALIESGRFPANRIVTHELPLSRINDAWGLMASGEALKVTILPGLT
jgi:L-iditol 2-dehydrogenase